MRLTQTKESHLYNNLREKEEYLLKIRAELKELEEQRVAFD